MTDLERLGALLEESLKLATAGQGTPTLIVLDAEGEARYSETLLERGYVNRGGGNWVLSRENAQETASVPL